MVKDLMGAAEGKMKGVIEATKREFASLRTGRANPSLLDRIQVEAYGMETPLNKLASISAPEPRLLVIQPWDKSIFKSVEKAILKSDLGLTPSNDGSVIRLAIPQLTEERRKDMVKLAKKVAEEMRVAIRNLRRDANEQVKAMEKGGDISEDELRIALEDVQSLTDSYIKQVDELLTKKEQEILEV